MFWPPAFPTKSQMSKKLNSLLSEPFSYLRQVNQTHFSYRSYFSIFVLRWDVVKLIKNPFIKNKRQLMLAN